MIGLVGDVEGEEVDYYRINPNFEGGGKVKVEETGNSIYKELSPFFNEPIIEKHVTHTIDNLVESVGLENDAFQIMKLDVQGSELKALRGAKKLIARSPDLIIITEVSIVPYNGGDAPSFFDIHLEMEKMGFRMIEIIDLTELTIDGSKSITLQMDVAWMRKEKVHWNGVKWADRDYGFVDSGS